MKRKMDRAENTNITGLARSLRRRLTESEKILWAELRNRRFLGLKFVRQQPLYSFYEGKRRYLFIADFYCAEKKLVVELDGEIHEQQKEYDENRDAVMIQRGLKVLRIENRELNNLEEVLEKIKNYT